MISVIAEILLAWKVSKLSLVALENNPYSLENE
jgi:hypothetical protein